MGEFIAAGLPVLVSSFGARGYSVSHRENAFVFERDGLLDALVDVRELFDSNPGELQRIAECALRDNAHAIDMNECVKPLIEIMNGG